MFGSLDPQQVRKVQEVSKNIRGRVKVDYTEKEILISLDSDDPKASEIIDRLLEQFSSVFATQLSSFFAIRGELIEVGKQ